MEVSIPQSGFGAFERRLVVFPPTSITPFQSLSRDSGRLNLADRYPGLEELRVSIPQSGFGAFELPVTATVCFAGVSFQSLSRDSGRLNETKRSTGEAALPGFNPSVGIRGV